MSNENEIPDGEEKLYVADGVLDTGTLRWTPLVMMIDLCSSAASVFGGIADFFDGQARSLAARATLNEALADRAIKLQVQKEARERMREHVLEDIAVLPEANEC
jgi:hypothetical protein